MRPIYTTSSASVRSDSRQGSVSTECVQRQGFISLVHYKFSSVSFLTTIHLVCCNTSYSHNTKKSFSSIALLSFGSFYDCTLANEADNRIANSETSITRTGFKFITRHYGFILKNNESNIRLFADNCIIYRKIKDSSDIDKLQTDLNRLGEWAVEKEIKVNPGKSKAVSFTKARVKERIRYYFGDQLIAETSSFKYLGIIIRSDLNWADHINYTL